MSSLEDAESRLDSLFAECGFASDHPAMQDWVAIKFVLKSDRQKSTLLPNCASCGNDKCGMQAGVCSKWLPVK